jgi:hypothetical protein
MYALNNKIARLEIRAEQLVIHLRSMRRNTTEAQHIRGVLLTMLERLKQFKKQRERLLDTRAEVSDG